MAAIESVEVVYTREQQAEATAHILGGRRTQVCQTQGHLHRSCALIDSGLTCPFCSRTRVQYGGKNKTTLEISSTPHSREFSAELRLLQDRKRQLLGSGPGDKVQGQGSKSQKKGQSESLIPKRTRQYPELKLKKLETKKHHHESRIPKRIKPEKKRVNVRHSRKRTYVCTERIEPVLIYKRPQLDNFVSGKLTLQDNGKSHTQDTKTGPKGNTMVVTALLDRADSSSVNRDIQDGSISSKISFPETVPASHITVPMTTGRTYLLDFKKYQITKPLSKIRETKSPEHAILGETEKREREDQLSHEPLVSSDYDSLDRSRSSQCTTPLEPLFIEEEVDTKNAQKSNKMQDEDCTVISIVGESTDASNKRQSLEEVRRDIETFVSDTDEYLKRLSFQKALRKVKNDDEDVVTENIEEPPPTIISPEDPNFGQALNNLQSAFTTLSEILDTKTSEDQAAENPYSDTRASIGVDELFQHWQAHMTRVFGVSSSGYETADTDTEDTLKRRFKKNEESPEDLFDRIMESLEDEVDNGFYDDDNVSDSKPTTPAPMDYIREGPALMQSYSTSVIDSRTVTTASATYPVASESELKPTLNVHTRNNEIVTLKSTDSHAEKMSPTVVSYVGVSDSIPPAQESNINVIEYASPPSKSSYILAIQNESTDHVVKAENSGSPSMANNETVDQHDSISINSDHAGLIPEITNSSKEVANYVLPQQHISVVEENVEVSEQPTVELIPHVPDISVSCTKDKETSPVDTKAVKTEPKVVSVKEDGLEDLVDLILEAAGNETEDFSEALSEGHSEVGSEGGLIFQVCIENFSMEDVSDIAIDKFSDSCADALTSQEDADGFSDSYLGILPRDDESDLFSDSCAGAHDVIDGSISKSDSLSDMVYEPVEAESDNAGSDIVTSDGSLDHTSPLPHDEEDNISIHSETSSEPDERGNREDVRSHDSLLGDTSYETCDNDKPRLAGDELVWRLSLKDELGEAQSRNGQMSVDSSKQMDSVPDVLLTTGITRIEPGQKDAEKFIVVQEEPKQADIEHFHFESGRGKEHEYTQGNTESYISQTVPIKINVPASFASGVHDRQFSEAKISYGPLVEMAPSKIEQRCVGETVNMREVKTSLQTKHTNIDDVPGPVYPWSNDITPMVTADKQTSSKSADHVEKWIEEHMPSLRLGRDIVTNVSGSSNKQRPKGFVSKMAGSINAKDPKRRTAAYGSKLTPDDAKVQKKIAKKQPKTVSSQVPLKLPGSNKEFMAGRSSAFVPVKARGKERPKSSNKLSEMDIVTKTTSLYPSKDDDIWDQEPKETKFLLESFEHVNGKQPRPLHVPKRSTKDHVHAEYKHVKDLKPSSTPPVPWLSPETASSVQSKAEVKDSPFISSDAFTCFDSRQVEADTQDLISFCDDAVILSNMCNNTEVKDSLSEKDSRDVIAGILEPFDAFEAIADKNSTIIETKSPCERAPLPDKHVASLPPTKEEVKNTVLTKAKMLDESETILTESKQMKSRGKPLSANYKGKKLGPSKIKVVSISDHMTTADDDVVCFKDSSLLPKSLSLATKKSLKHFEEDLEESKGHKFTCNVHRVVKNKDLMEKENKDFGHLSALVTDSKQSGESDVGEVVSEDVTTEEVTVVFKYPKSLLIPPQIPPVVGQPFREVFLRRVTKIKDMDGKLPESSAVKKKKKKYLTDKKEDEEREVVLASAQ